MVFQAPSVCNLQCDLEASPSRRTSSESSDVFFPCDRSQLSHRTYARRWLPPGLSEPLCSLLCLYAGTNPSRPGAFPGANSPGPVADLYGPSSQESAVGNYISAASPQPGSGFGPSITVSTRRRRLPLGRRSHTKPMHILWLWLRRGELPNYCTGH